MPYYPPGGGGSSGVSSFNGRTGAVVPTAGDYTVAEVTGAVGEYVGTITGDASTTVFTVTHNLGTVDLAGVSVWEAASPTEQVFPTIATNGINAVTATFSAAPASGVVYNVIVSAA